MHFLWQIKISQAYRALNRHEQIRVLALLHIFKEVDTRVALFKKKSGLSCSRYCGKCCEFPTVSTTILEMMPMALYVWKRKEVDSYYALAKGSSFPGQCLFYSSGKVYNAQGHCSQYHLRPLICRSYGFSGRVDKHDHVDIITCEDIKKAMKLGLQEGRRVDRRVNPPVMADIMRRVYLLDPDLCRDKLPINLAFSEAVEKIGLVLSCKQKNQKRGPVRAVPPLTCNLPRIL